MFIPVYATNISDYEKLDFDREFFIKTVDEEKGYISYDTGKLGNSNVFPDVSSLTDENDIRNKILLRDLKGIKFSLKTGEIICRPHCKIFNIGEREESSMKIFDFTKDHELFLKLDGSMITPMIPDDGNLYYTTKKGVTQITPFIDKFVNSSDILYDDFCKEMIKNNYTPIFEWCSRSQRIVIDYPYDMLVVTAIRHMFTGEYMSSEDIEQYVKDFTVPFNSPIKNNTTSITEFVSTTKNLNDIEGYIVLYNNCRYKIKTDSYVSAHRALEGISFEKDIIMLICENKLDDVIPLLPENKKEGIMKFEKDFYENVKHAVNEVIDIAKIYMKETNNKKEFSQIINSKQYNASYISILFSVYDILSENTDSLIVFDRVKENIINRIIKHCINSNKLELIRYIFKINYNDY